jgi:hypothetical protein
MIESSVQQGDKWTKIMRKTVMGCLHLHEHGKVQWKSLVETKKPPKKDNMVVNPIGRKFLV